MDGLLLVDKPKGWTSFDVVAKVRSLLKKAGTAKPKVGHVGTLDPLATGLLVLTLGSYCKRAQEFLKQDKTYEVTMKLGETSTTGDAEGKITPIPNSYKIMRSHNFVRVLKNVMRQFEGEIDQVPPAYSAIKVGGQRAYKLARAGKAITLQPRKVHIYRIELTDYTYPFVTYTAAVSSGTYIRSLVEDIGQKLGTGAYLAELRRTQVGPFHLHNAVSVQNLSADTVRQALTK